MNDIKKNKKKKKQQQTMKFNTFSRQMADKIKIIIKRTTNKNNKDPKKKNIKSNKKEKQIEIILLMAMARVDNAAYAAC